MAVGHKPDNNHLGLHDTLGEASVPKRKRLLPFPKVRACPIANIQPPPLGISNLSHIPPLVWSLSLSLWLHSDFNQKLLVKVGGQHILGQKDWFFTPLGGKLANFWHASLDRCRSPTESGNVNGTLANPIAGFCCRTPLNRFSWRREKRLIGA